MWNIQARMMWIKSYTTFANPTGQRTSGQTSFADMPFDSLDCYPGNPVTVPRLHCARMHDKTYSSGYCVFLKNCLYLLPICKMFFTPPPTMTMLSI